MHKEVCLQPRARILRIVDESIVKHRHEHVLAVLGQLASVLPADEAVQGFVEEGKVERVGRPALQRRQPDRTAVGFGPVTTRGGGVHLEKGNILRLQDGVGVPVVERVASAQHVGHDLCDARTGSNPPRPIQIRAATHNGPPHRPTSEPHSVPKRAKIFFMGARRGGRRARARRAAREEQTARQRLADVVSRVLSIPELVRNIDTHILRHCSLSFHVSLASGVLGNLTMSGEQTYPTGLVQSLNKRLDACGMRQGVDCRAHTLTVGRRVYGALQAYFPGFYANPSQAAQTIAGVVASRLVESGFEIHIARPPSVRASVTKDDARVIARSWGLQDCCRCASRLT